LSSYTYPGGIAIIMDGNSRWARMRGLDTAFGHKKGAERVNEVINACSENSVKNLSLFAFSSENWKRPDEEIDALMQLLVEFINEKLNDMKSKNILFKFSGRRDRFSNKVNAALDKAVSSTMDNTGLNLILCLDYGGRQEILDAVNKVSGRIISEKELSRNLYVPEFPEIDLLIRTSGEERISNFMLWQMSYAELYFTDVLWPDFSSEHLEKAVKSFNRRQRRFGLRE